MGDPAALLAGNLGGADVHSDVELHGVGVHDLATEPLGEVQRETGLARAVAPTTATMGGLRSSCGTWLVWQ